MRVMTLESARSTETPAATMRTYASPTTDTPATVAVWRSELASGSVGPMHTVSEDQVVVVIQGTLTVEIDGRVTRVAPCQSVVLRADHHRRLSAPDGDVVTVTASVPGATARVGDSPQVPVPWAR